MALLLPAFLLLVLGMLDLGRAVYTYNVLSNAVRDGCRVAIVDSNTNAAVIQAVRQSAVAVNLSPANVTISGARTPGSTVTVSALFVFQPVTPLIRGIVGTAIQLRAQSAMVVD
jgi:Flp pilus assembly protein TadG